MISVARTTMGNVKHWKDGSMKKRWVAAGMLEAERNFRRVRGYKDMPTPRRRPRPSHPRRSRHTRQLRSGRCLIKQASTAELQQKAGHPLPRPSRFVAQCRVRFVAASSIYLGGELERTPA